jgi:hypothetical protein
MSNRFIYRILEIIPGSLVWGTFVLAIGLSFFRPLWVIYFIIIFNLYWILRILHFMIHLVSSWKKYRETIRKDWHSALVSLPPYRFNRKVHWHDIYHLVIFPTFQEPLEIMKAAFESLVNIKYPLDKLIVVLAGEERDRENFLKRAEIIKKEYGDKFFKFLITLHPKDLPGEIPCKASNLLWAGKKARELIDDLKIPYENIIVSPFDMETCVHPQYFSRVTYEYLTHPQALQRSYQPVIVFNNNYWESPAFTRVLASFFTFGSLFHLARPEWLFSACSHSLPFKALNKVGFWDPDVITDDHRIFLKCFGEYKGDYQSIPLYLPVSMDTVSSGSLWQTAVNQYKQQRRWAWGVENFPYMVWNFFIKKRGWQIPFLKKIRYLWILSVEMYFWAVVPILILGLSYLPRTLARGEIKESLLLQNTPFFLDYLRWIAIFALVLFAFLGSLMLPPRPSGHSRWEYIWMILQWLLYPWCTIIFGSFPAIEAQTRLMLGRPLGWHATKKHRAASGQSF